jgi:ribosome maturation factor RimP
VIAPNDWADSSSPFFLAAPFLIQNKVDPLLMNWQRAVEDTVTGLGYDLVDAEKSAGGLLRVYIDHLPPSTAAITVDDCEKVTRQLQHVLEVEGASYERLEVSSPGLDRPLKKAADYARFVGEQVELTLKLPFKGRKKYTGELQPQGGEAGDGWRLVLVSEKQSHTRATKRAAVQAAAQAPDEAANDLALDFSLDEVREARLVPVVDFKGRRLKAPAEIESPAGTGPHVEVEGGRIQ